MKFDTLHERFLNNEINSTQLLLELSLLVGNLKKVSHYTLQVLLFSSQ